MKFLKESKKHLTESGWSYWKHLTHSFKQSNRLCLIALKSIVHGFLPWIYTSAGPLGVYKIYQEIRRLHHVQKIFQKYDQES